MKSFLHRWLFVGLSTAVLVFFSEKTYWYPQGYAIVQLILYYALPVFACLWAIDYFRVRRLSALVLVAALFGFLVEGVLTPVMYEGGLLDPVMPAYFIGWHGLVGLMFGWYGLQRWLINGRWSLLLGGSVGFGLLWGTWSLTYWLPVHAADFSGAAQWSLPDFALHAFTFTLMLMAAHGLLARGGWPARFRPGRAERWIVLAVLVFYFVAQVVPFAPLGILKLGALLALLALPLARNRQRERATSVLAQLNGPVQFRHLALLLTMPLAATAVYGAATLLQPAPETLQLILELKPLLHVLAGAVVFVWALVATLRPLPATTTTSATDAPKPTAGQ